MSQARVSTGVVGLDEMLHGGFLPGSMVLVRGAPGTGKTSLGMQFLIHGATRQGETGLLITFEEFPASLYRDAASLGWDLEPLEREGKLHLLFASPEVFLEGLEMPDSPLNRLLQEGDVRRLVLDSITHFNRLASDPHELRHIYTRVANGLRREGVTGLLLGEEGRREATRTDRGGLSFIADSILLLRYLEVESTIQRAIVVLKMRGSDHAKEIRRFEIRRGGLVVGEAFEGRQGLLSGISYRTP
ncbi:MAG TPA: ATPase [Anaerolineales bacterium]|nr:ATPase [Anaerolineae bacterium]HIQ01083.1 ATPase [Anaerolineales bacterium]